MATPRKKAANESVSVDGVEEVKPAEQNVGNTIKTKSEPVVLSEFSHQMEIFKDFAYHVGNKGAGIKVTNLGYGDLYCSMNKPVAMDNANRLFTGESKTFKGDVVYFLSASQPVVEILEVM